VSERPQNKNLKPLGSGARSPDEERAIRSKGAMETHKARKRNADMRAAVQAFANLRFNGKGKSIDAEKMKSLDELDNPEAPMIMKVVNAQFVKAIQGDPEARDWICKMLGVDPHGPVLPAPGLTITADGQAVEDAGGVRIHLIRGEKSENTDTAEDEATRAAARLSMVEAMKAIGEAANSPQDTKENVMPDE